MAGAGTGDPSDSFLAQVSLDNFQLIRERDNFGSNYLTMYPIWREDIPRVVKWNPCKKTFGMCPMLIV